MYEKLVRDDEDLISRRVACYRRNPVGRVLADTVILVTALHLSEAVPEDLDVFHWGMKYLRKTIVDASTTV